jgi:hypothetical protein
VKKYSTCLAIKKMQIKTILRFYLTPVTMAINKKEKKKTKKYWQQCGGKRALIHCWWKCKLVQPIWKSV